MAKEIEIFQVNAFTKQIFMGNPAGVVISDNLSDNEMQLIARQMNLSETAFISKSKIADYRLRWFTTLTEVELCGHATIASLHILKEKKLRENITVTFETLSGIINCAIEDNKYIMQLPTPQLTHFNGNKDEVIECLGLNKKDVCDLPFIKLNNGYLFIPVKSIDVLWSINPNFNGLIELSKSKKMFYDIAVFTTETVEQNSIAHLRFFAPYYGINEDPVTGSACGPLLLVLSKLGLINYKDDGEVIIEQGDFLKRKGRVTVSYKSLTNNLNIAGNAVTVLNGIMRF